MSELTYEKTLKLLAESRRNFEETTRRMEIQSAESDRRIDKVQCELRNKLAEFGDTLDKFADEQVRADILNRFSNWGIPVHSITNHFEQRNKTMNLPTKLIY